MKFSNLLSRNITTYLPIPHERPYGKECNPPLVPIPIVSMSKKLEAQLNAKPRVQWKSFIYVIELILKPRLANPLELNFYIGPPHGHRNKRLNKRSILMKQQVIV